MASGGTVGRCMAAAGVGVMRGVFLRKPAVQSAEQLVCKSSRPIAVEGNELTIKAGEAVPRSVFGGVPTFQESKEATTEFKELIDRMYLPSSKPFESETSMIPALKHVHQALRLLSSNSAIQNMIASIASDEKVFEAVLDNPQIKNLFLEHQTSSHTSDLEDKENVTQLGESGAGVIGKLRNLKDFVIEMVTGLPIHLPELFESASLERACWSDHKENIKVKAFKLGSGLVEKLRNLKNSVVEMATNIPKYFSNLYGSSAAESFSGSDHEGNTQGFPPDFSFGISLTGLVVLVIMIVLFKRV